jgi:hypothetical protein
VDDIADYLVGIDNLAELSEYMAALGAEDDGENFASMLLEMRRGAMGSKKGEGPVPRANTAKGGKKKGPNQKERLMQKKLDAGVELGNSWEDWEGQEDEAAVTKLGGYKKKDDADDDYFGGMKKKKLKLRKPAPTSSAAGVAASASSPEAREKSSSNQPKEKLDAAFIKRQVKAGCYINCTNCGLIIYQYVASCSFCRQTLLWDKAVKKQEGTLKEEPVSEREQEAIAHKQRLLEYDRSSAQRTYVFDDQADYFER